MTLPVEIIKIINKIPKEFEVLRDLIEKNHQYLDLDKIKAIDFKNEENQTEYYDIVIKDILSSNSEALELLRNLSVLNCEIETNIDRKILEKSYEVENFHVLLDHLLETGIMRLKTGTEGTLEFASEHIQNTMLSLADESCHENAVKYYEEKSKVFSADYHNVTEILRHQSEIAINDELAVGFLGVYNMLRYMGFGVSELITIGEKMLNLDDKYKAPILVALGNLYADSGRSEDAEDAYLAALDTYRQLAKTYYKIYLPYVATVHNHLGKLYADLKRFEEAEKIYLESLRIYKELEEKYKDIFSPDDEDLQFEGKPLEHVYPFADVDLPVDLDPEKLCQEAFEDYKEVLKDYHDIFLPDMNKTQDEIGHVYIDLDLLGEKKGSVLDEPTLKKLYAKTCYDGHLADVATTYSNLGLTYSEMDQFNEAERMHLAALRIRSKLAEQYPDKHLPLLAIIQSDLARLYTHLYRDDDAEAMHLDFLETKKDLSERNPNLYLADYLIAVNNVGNFYLNKRRYKEAEKLYLQSLEGFEKLTWKQRKDYEIDISIITNNVGNVYLFLNENDKAKKYLDEALKKNPTNGDILYNSACIEAIFNNAEKALELLAKAIEVNIKFKTWAKTDRFLHNVKELPEFKKLIGMESENKDQKT